MYKTYTIKEVKAILQHFKDLGFTTLRTVISIELGSKDDKETLDIEVG